MAVRLHGYPTGPNEPLFIFENGQYLTNKALASQIRLLLPLVGIDPLNYNYSAYSLHAEGANNAAISGLQDWEIKVLAR